MARRIEAALGLRSHNALGTTETMQVLSTVLDEDAKGPAWARRCRESVSPSSHWAGRTASADSCCRVPSAFPVTSPPKRVSDPSRPPTGIRPAIWCGARLAASSSRAVSRRISSRTDSESRSRATSSRSATRDLGDPVVHVECFPLSEEPGLGALIFTNDEGVPAMAEVRQPLTDRPLLRRIRGLLEARHESFVLALDEFELRHLTISRFACLPGPPPRTSKGNLSRAEIARNHDGLLKTLLGKPVKRPGLVRLDTGSTLRSSSTRFVRPRLGKMLQLLRLDKDYVSGRGDRLVMRDKGVDREVVDFVGGFGATLLGHRHPEVIAATRRFLEGEAVPFADQGSGSPPGGRLRRAGSPSW